MWADLAIEMQSLRVAFRSFDKLAAWWGRFYY